MSQAVGFRLAKKEALQSEMTYRVGAAITQNGKPVAVGRNHHITKKPCHPSIHSEMDALESLFRQKGCLPLARKLLSLRIKGSASADC